MITDALTETATALWADASYYLTLQFVSPFWGWLIIGLGIILAAWLIAHFFGQWIPALRPIAGVVVLLVTFGLYAYRRGENDTRARLERRKPVAPKPKPPDDKWRW